MVNGMIKDPLYVLVLSWGADWIVRMIPTTGDRYVTTKVLQRAGTVTENAR
jgi:hypothetical protein